ncbi:MAG: 4-(cytidine 5'-diphospho)-2-C-methyl-D-erythritol kinase [Verrucomicrobiota bacterium]
MQLERSSHGKVNLILNILGKRPDGFHELETVLQPVPLQDRLRFRREGKSVVLTCSDSNLPADESNLVHRAATAFLRAARISEGVRIELEKNIPMAAGLGGGSGNAAATLLGLNELFDAPLAVGALHQIASNLGSDVPFFLADGPALATGRGEEIERLESFPVLRNVSILLFHPGFGISTPWAYRKLADFPQAVQGRSGRARELVRALQQGSLADAAAHFYNSLEAPALHKYPILDLYQEFLRAHGATVALMSGSGSTTFALVERSADAEKLARDFRENFGDSGWMKVLALGGSGI